MLKWAYPPLKVVLLAVYVFPTQTKDAVNALYCVEAKCSGGVQAGLFCGYVAYLTMSTRGWGKKFEVKNPGTFSVASGSALNVMKVFHMIQ